MLIETAIGGENIGQILDGRARYPVRVRYARSLRSTPEAMSEILVPVGMNATASSPANATSAEAAPQQMESGSQAGGMGGMSGGAGGGGSSSTGAISTVAALAPAANYVRLGDLATIRLADGPAMIASENGQLRSVVFLNVRGRDMGGFVKEAKEQLASQLKLSTGYSVEWSGQYENKQRAESRLIVVMPVVFLVIFLMLYMTMKDWKEAGVVMLSVPFALVGGIYLLYGLGYNLSVAVWVGFIALYGVAVQTGVVMVVYLHHALDAKLAAGHPVTADDLHDATIEGAVQRLRPKLMTVATSMLGLVPIMFADGAGSDVMKPLVTPMIGGLLTSAVHVLIMTPVLFIMMKERALRKGKLSKSQMADWMA